MLEKKKVRFTVQYPHPPPKNLKLRKVYILRQDSPTLREMDLGLMQIAVQFVPPTPYTIVIGYGLYIISLIETPHPGLLSYPVALPAAVTDIFPGGSAVLFQCNGLGPVELWHFGIFPAHQGQTREIQTGRRAQHAHQGPKVPTRKGCFPG